MSETLKTAEPREIPHRCWYKFRLRTLLVVVTLAGSGFAWIGLKVRESRRQQAAVAAIEKLGRKVRYDYEVDAQGDLILNATPPGPSWLRAVVGDDIFRSVYAVSFHELPSGPAPNEDVLANLEAFHDLKQLDLRCTGELVTDSGLKHVEGLTNLESLNLEFTKVTDAGLDHLKGLVQLKELSLWETKVTDAGVARLQQALPNCEIGR